MGAILRIKAALAAGPTEGVWVQPKPESMGVHIAENNQFGYGAALLVAHGSETVYQNPAANCAYVVAVQPAAIREVLQTLASNEAELVRVLSRWRGAGRILARTGIRSRFKSVWLTCGRWKACASSRSTPIPQPNKGGL